MSWPSFKTRNNDLFYCDSAGFKSVKAAVPFTVTGINVEQWKRKYSALLLAIYDSDNEFIVKYIADNFDMDKVYALPQRTADLMKQGVVKYYLAKG